MEPIVNGTPEHKPRGLLRRLLLALLVLAVIGVGAWQAWERWGSDDEAPRYSLVDVERRDVMSQVTATGTVNPVVQVQVGSQVSGRVKELFADYNSEVKKGQVIATLEPQLFDSAIAQSRARLSSARANVRRAEAVAENARQQYKRISDLAKNGVVAGAEVDTALAEQRSAEAQVNAARAEVTLAQAAVDESQVNLEYATIRSPIDGVVVARSIDVGQTVAASLQAPTLFLIAEDLRKMEVHASVAESDVGQITPGMKAEFTVDAFPDRTFAGTVKQVRYEPQNTSNVVTYDAVVSVANDKLELRPGMTANVSFIAAERNDVLVVPNKALRFRPPDAPASGDRAGRGDRPARGDRPVRGDRPGRGGARKRTVWKLVRGKPAPVRIEVGLTDGTSTEVAEGELREGDQIITGIEGQTAEPAGQDGQQRQRGGGRRGPPRVF